MKFKGKPGHPYGEGIQKTAQAHRDQGGNMLVLVTAVTVGIIAVIAYFSLAYVRLLGSNHEQRTAVEAAALAAARDLSRIVINTPEFGLVSLSDSAPTGNDTTVGDGYKVPVRSINSLMATVRLDLIIADKLGDATLKSFVKADQASVVSVHEQIATELNNALQRGYTAKDINGEDLDIYADAEKAYQQNQVRQTGSSTYRAGNLKLTLGALTGGSITNTPLPKPTNWANVPADGQQNGFYKSYVNCPYDNADFVFAGIADSVKLVDSRNWASQVPSLPFQLPTIIKAEATQAIASNQTGSALNVHAIACAQPANIADPKPAPGALTFSFPDGLCPELPGPSSFLNSSLLMKTNGATFQTSKKGDFPMGRPTTNLKDMRWPYTGTQITTSNVFRRALYDWWNRAGAKLDMASAVAMFNDPTYNFTAPSPAMIDWKSPAKQGDPTIYKLGQIPNGNIHIYRVDPRSGLISYQTKDLAPIKYSVVGENQLYSESIGAITNSAVGKLNIPTVTLATGEVILDKAVLLDGYDIYIRDQVYQLGSILGGKHSGEPMDFDKVAINQQQIGGRGMGAFPRIIRSIIDFFFGSRSREASEESSSSSTSTTTVVKGNGLPPAITPQSDFAETMGYPNSYYYTYSTGPGSRNGLRPTYLTNGMAVDIRVRRQVDPGSMANYLGAKTGYVGEKYGTAVPATEASSAPPTGL